VENANALRKFEENEFFDRNKRIVHKLNTTSDHIFFLITTLLLIALVLGTFVQTLNFILNSNIPDAKITILYLALTPIILLFFAALIDDFIALIFDSMDSPPFLKARAQIIVVFSNTDQSAFKAIKVINFTLITGFEIIPILTVGLNCYLSERITLDLVVSGYVLGGAVFALLLGIVYTTCHLINSRSENAQDYFFDYELALNGLEAREGFGSSSSNMISNFHTEERDKRVVSKNRNRGFLFSFIAIILVTVAIFFAVFGLASTIFVTSIFCVALLGLRFSIKAFVPNFIRRSFTFMIITFSVVAISMNLAATVNVASNDGLKPLVEFDSRNLNQRSEVNSANYPVCMMEWKNTSDQNLSNYLTLMDLVPLTEIIYNYYPTYYDDTNDIENAIARIYDGTDIGNVIVEQIDPMSQFARSAVVYFKDLKIRVLVIRGTQIPAEMLYDLDVFSFVQILNLFDKITPVIGLLPSNFISKMVAFVDLGRIVDIDDPSEYLFNKAQEYYSSSIESNDEFIVLGHSLGGTLAGTIASRLGVSAVAINPAGSKSILERFKVPDEGLVYKSLTTIKMDKDVISKIDKHMGSVNTLSCKNLTPLECHDPKAILCELYRICGDERNRKVITGCTSETFEKFVAEDGQ